MDLLKHNITAIETCRQMREMLLDDRYRPGYHFAIPEDNGFPADPNGIFYANGRYHLFYLYCRTSGGCGWGHVSSKDLLHWRSHKDALVLTVEDSALCSGGAFVDEDGTAYIVYATYVGKRTGCRIAYSRDRHFDTWTDIGDFIMETPTIGISTMPDENGVEDYVGTMDPSNIWKKDGKYYLLTGNYFVLKHFRDQQRVSEKYQGDWSDLFCSEDMKTWRFIHRFYTRDPMVSDTQPNEDAMCACFLPLPASKNGGVSNKHILLFISHVMGAQYYIGTYDTANDRFIPEQHGRFTSTNAKALVAGGHIPVQGALTAPEALIAPDGRLINYFWILDNMDYPLNKLWRGMYSLPVELWLNEDGHLGIAPIRELTALEYNSWRKEPFCLDGELVLPDDLPLETCHFHIVLSMMNASRVAIRTLSNGIEWIEIAYDRTNEVLMLDCINFNLDLDTKGRSVELTELVLKENEDLTLDIYLDKSTVEVFANDRAIVAHVVYPNETHTGSTLLSDGTVSVKDMVVHEMMPSNMY